MRFFITGETYSTVAEKTRITIVKIGPKINSLFTKQNYGTGITYWGHIIISGPSEMYQAGFFKEIKKYIKKKNDVETRLRVDYEEMLRAEGQDVFKLICQSIFRSVDIAENEFKIKDFDFRAFHDDLTSLFKKEGWI